MDWNISKIFKIYGILCLITLLINISLIFFDYYYDLDFTKFLTILSDSVLIPLAVIVLSAVIFSPAIGVLYLLLKKIKNVIVRIFIVAFIVPFSNMIYYLTEYSIYKDEFGISLTIGFFALFMVLPLTGVTCLFMPKSLLHIKKEVVWTIILMEIIGWILVMISFDIVHLVFTD